MTQHDKNRFCDVIVILPKIDFVYCGVIANYITTQHCDHR